MISVGHDAIRRAREESGTNYKRRTPTCLPGEDAMDQSCDSAQARENMLPA